MIGVIWLVVISGLSDFCILWSDWPTVKLHIRQPCPSPNPGRLPDEDDINQVKVNI